MQCANFTTANWKIRVTQRNPKNPVRANGQTSYDQGWNWNWNSALPEASGGGTKPMTELSRILCIRNRHFRAVCSSRLGSGCACKGTRYPRRDCHELERGISRDAWGMDVGAPQRHLPWWNSGRPDCRCPRAGFRHRRKRGDCRCSFRLPAPVRQPRDRRGVGCHGPDRKPHHPNLVPQADNCLVRLLVAFQRRHFHGRRAGWLVDGQLAAIRGWRICRYALLCRRDQCIAGAGRGENRLVG